MSLHFAWPVEYWLIGESLVCGDYSTGIENLNSSVKYEAKVIGYGAPAQSNNAVAVAKTAGTSVGI